MRVDFGLDRSRSSFSFEARLPVRGRATSLIWGLPPARRSERPHVSAADWYASSQSQSPSTASGAARRSPKKCPTPSRHPPLPATVMLAQTTLRAVLGQHELDEMMSERKKSSAPTSRASWTPKPKRGGSRSATSRSEPSSARKTWTTRSHWSVVSERRFADRNHSSRESPKAGSETTQTRVRGG
jgi:hypothetical protein